MKRVAVVQDGVVTNVIIIDDAADPSAFGVEDKDATVGPGDRWDGSSFTRSTPEAPPETTLDELIRKVGDLEQKP